MFKALIIASMLGQAADAPIAEAPVVGTKPEAVFEMRDNDGKQFVCMTNEHAIKVAGEVKGCQAFEDHVKEQMIISPALFVGVVVGTLLLGVAAGAAGVALVKK